MILTHHGGPQEKEDSGGCGLIHLCAAPASGQRPGIQPKIKWCWGYEQHQLTSRVSMTLSPMTVLLPPSCLTTPCPWPRTLPSPLFASPSLCTRFPGLHKPHAALVTFDVWPRFSSALCSTNSTRLGSFHVNLMMRTGIHVTDSIDHLLNGLHGRIRM